MQTRLSLIFICTALLFACSKKNENASPVVVRDSIVRESVKEEISKVNALPVPDTAALKKHSVLIRLLSGDTFTLSLPEGFQIRIAAEGMKRIRFMDRSPDGRLFLTDMHNLADNSNGKIWILEEADSLQRFSKITKYLDRLRNPNSIAFHTDKQRKKWLYVALTDKLVRYAYQDGDIDPQSSPETLDTWPDYGLSYRYGGWHLIRTIQFNNEGRLYVSVGSSCNTCIEKEEVRASVIVMDEDGKNRRVFARGLRNAVGMTLAEGNLYATNMAADHLGVDKPDDALFRIDDKGHYGWPWCYHWQGRVYQDARYDTVPDRVRASDVKEAVSYLGAHTAPLGVEWFGQSEASDPALQNYFLVAQHGSYSASIGRGYSLQRVREKHAPEDFITGFLDDKNIIHGRPCGILPAGVDRFYFTDDKNGVLYYVYKD